MKNIDLTNHFLLTFNNQFKKYNLFINNINDISIISSIDILDGQIKVNLLNKNNEKLIGHIQLKSNDVSTEIKKEKDIIISIVKNNKILFEVLQPTK
tara:strand:+ start:1495 stop:1785 length:291 start_codon:yes stop_codon:yes gene_type:complete